MKRASLPGADLEAEQGRELVVERSLEHEVVGAGAQLGPIPSNFFCCNQQCFKAHSY